jgi:hypothetical protein
MKHQRHTTKNMLSPEQGLSDEIQPFLRQFDNHRIHHITKKDKPESAARTASDACIRNILLYRTPIPAKYYPTGPATVWHQRKKISTQIETTIRNAATTSELYQYMNTKYNWSDKTINSIDWMIHKESLTKFPTNQRKTITQLIHEWLPVNGHPGRSMIDTNKLCPHYIIAPETQIHFSQCPTTSTHWHSLVEEQINQCLTPSKHKHLITLIIWALTAHPLEHNQIPDSIP